MGAGQPLSYLSGETSGLDMEFQVGLTMDSAGDIRLGLQLTRVLDASYEATTAYSPTFRTGQFPIRSTAQRSILTGAKAISVAACKVLP